MNSDHQKMNIALIEVDPQVDFGTVDGALYVPRGEEIVKELNDLRIALHDADLLCSVVLTQDSHPADHISFQKNNPGSELFKEHVLSCGSKQMMWPVHCQDGDRRELGREAQETAAQEAQLRFQSCEECTV